MEKYFVPSAQYWDEDYINCFEGKKILASEDFVKMPVLPLNFSKTDAMYSDDGNSIILINEKKSLRYFYGNSGECKNSSRYFKNDRRYEYHPIDEEKAKSYINYETEMTSGEHLGSFDVDGRLCAAINLYLKAFKSIKNIKGVYKNLKKTAAILIFQNSDGEVLINLRLIDESLDLPGLGDIRMHCEGVIKQGIVLKLNIDQAKDVARLSRYLKKDVRVRISQSPEDPSEAVLTWQSSQIDGTAMTMATIVCL